MTDRQGRALLDAVALMDRLRSPGGCPWDASQTHESLLRYLVEECYELVQAVEDGDVAGMREELGDVLLQVLFHARIAEDAPEHPFGIDDVADALLRKLGNRVPTVLAGQEISLEDQVAQWHERKALEKASRNSIMDDLSTAQPALALASKVLQRVTRAGLPAELIPDAITAVTITADGDVENRLRTAILEFMDTVRAVEEAIAAARGGVDVLDDPAPLGEISEAEWRTHWPQL